jgi:hypothetical protein
VVGLLLVVAAMNLGAEQVYHRYLYPSPRPTLLPPTLIPTRTPTPAPTFTPVPTAPVSPTTSLTATLSPTPVSYQAQELEASLRRALFQQQLLKASVELLRAEDYLSSNEIKQVERELIAVSTTLEQGRAFADESLQDTIADLQRDLSRLREDLYLRPERLDDGIRRLWQRVDVLIGE